VTESYTSLKYSDAGVNIDAGNNLVKLIKETATKTYRPEVLSGLGGFGAMCEIPKGYESPVLIFGTDGVGTKLEIAKQLNRHNTIGIDLVAMCVNDLIVCGGEPLYFLDYYATGKLDVSVATEVVSGIANGCKIAGCSLVGGETAEMPGMYRGTSYDLAGFCTGIVEKNKIIMPNMVKQGDSVIAIASSGPHSNGYSLIRHIIQHNQINLHDNIDGKPLADLLLEPTRIYVKSILSLLKNQQVNGICHITGGGLLENIPRVIPSELQAVINTASWEFPLIFDWIQNSGNIDRNEMFRTFNCGVGMVVIVPSSEKHKTIEYLTQSEEIAWDIGTIDIRPINTEQVILN